MAWSKKDWLEYDNRCAAAYKKWVERRNMTREEVADAYRKWTGELEELLIQRTGLDLDSFLDYPIGELFLLEELTPTEAANQIIEIEGVKEIKHRNFYIVRTNKE